MKVEIKKCDWLFLGDSYTQGAQVEYNQLVTSQLYSHFPDKIIVNAGMSGFGVPQEYLLFKDLIKVFKPEKVFLQLCNFNDFMNVEIKSMGFTDLLMYYSDLARYVLYGLKFQPTSDLPLGRWTEPFYPTEKNNVEYNVFYKRTSKKKETDLKELKRYIHLIHKEVNKIGAELILFLIPTKEQIYYEYFEEVIENFHINVQELDMTYPNRILSLLSDSMNIEFIDLTEDYSKSSGNVFFYKDEHLSPYGHFVTASILADKIKKRNIYQTSVKLLGSISRGDRYPRYSKDGNKITFQSLGETSYEIMITDDHFSNVTRLTNNDIDEIHPVLSPNGDLIAFTEGAQEDLRTKVAIMKPDGSGKRLITRKPNQFGAIPMFSSDGRFITFAQWYFDESKREYTLPQIVYSDLFGDEEIIITNNHYENWRPIFSQDDQSIIYISKRSGNFDIYEYFFSTKKEVNLTNTPYDEWDPNLSPIGDKIIYAANKDGNWDLFIMQRDGSNEIQLTFTKGDEWDPSFSNYENKIIYAGEFGFLGGIYKSPIINALENIK